MPDMKQENTWKNQLWYGDNLDVLRKIPSDYVDLIYLDPPFNSNANYNMLFKEKDGTTSQAQAHAFEDTWSWNGNKAEEVFDELIETCGNNRLVKQMQSLRTFVGDNNLMAYLTMMAIRLIEMRRVLKDTGSIYLHCDPTASHYIKLILDAVFGVENYRNEITWKRKHGFSSSVHTSKQFGVCTDIIFFYSKTENSIFYPQYNLNAEGYKDYIDKFFCHSDENGRKYQLDNLANPAPRPNLMYDYKGYKHPKNGWAISKEKMEQWDKEGRLHFPENPEGRIRRKRYLDELKGMPIQNLWDDIEPIGAHALEKLGYPTQKPEALLERIIKASSNEGDLILDPFCGCGTAVVVAEKLHRKWMGIDITYLAIKLIRERLEKTFTTELSPFVVEGVPKDIASAIEMATATKKGRFQFEWWALDMVGADYAGEQKMSADKGLDGIKMFKDDPHQPHKKVIFQVKSGDVKFNCIQQLKGAMKDEDAVIGVLITLEKPTKPMVNEAAKEGFYVSPLYPDRKFPKIQILTIEDIFNKVMPEYPISISFDLYKQATKQRKEKPEEVNLFEK